MPFAAGIHYFFHEGEDVRRPPVILIHGAGGNHLYWPPEVRRLAPYRIFALDLPGHGKSSGVGLQSINDYVRSVVNFMDAVGLWRAVIVGHSMGGAIALTLALDHADQVGAAQRVAGLGLIGTGARLRVFPAMLSNTANPATFSLAVQTINEWAFGPQADPHLKALAAKRMAETRPAVLHGDLLACDAFDVMDRLSEIRVPTLIICGTEDKLTPLTYSKTLASQIPGAALQTVDSAGHMVMLEEPRRVAGALTVFLKTVPYQPGK
ncbi:MAG: alpha/beta hydrolase [Anaerolineales bacterium]|nr:alpha/beta hydrolase [Anaerolineales bacterium]